jgi:hypothetical protein
MEFDPRDGSTLGKQLPTKLTLHSTIIHIFNICPGRSVSMTPNWIIWSNHFEHGLAEKKKEKEEQHHSKMNNLIEPFYPIEKTSYLPACRGIVFKIYYYLVL